MENVNDQIRSKDEIIEDILAQIAEAKQDKDAIQNETLFKK